MQNCIPSHNLISVIFCVLINPRGWGACAAKVTILDLCLCVFACSYDGTTGSYEQYRRLENYQSLEIKMGIFLKPLFSRYMACFQYE